MKVAVIGYGNVGMAVFSALMNMPEITELVLCGRNIQRIRGEVLDCKDIQALNSANKTKLSGGGYEACKGADIIIYTVGAPVREKAGDRNDLAEDNVAVVKTVAEELNKYNKDAIIIAISNPVDVLVSALMKCTDRPRGKVIGTGTLLDTARLRRYIAEIFDVRPQNVMTYVLGEHGDSSCIMWSWTSILGMDIQEFLNAELDEELSIKRDMLLNATRRMGGNIHQLKGSTAYGVAAAAAQLVSAIVHDTHEIMPVSIRLNGEYGIQDVAMSVPCYVSAHGAEPIKASNMTDEERDALNKSADGIRELTNRFV